MLVLITGNAVFLGTHSFTTFRQAQAVATTGPFDRLVGAPRPILPRRPGRSAPGKTSGCLVRAVHAWTAESGGSFCSGPTPARGCLWWQRALQDAVEPMPCITAPQHVL